MSSKLCNYSHILLNAILWRAANYEEAKISSMKEKNLGPISYSASSHPSRQCLNNFMYSIANKGGKFLTSVWLGLNWNASSTIVHANSTSKLDVILNDTTLDGITRFIDDPSWVMKSLHCFYQSPSLSFCKYLLSAPIITTLQQCSFN